jgi:hypothetical protein
VTFTAAERRGQPREPRYALCECGAFLGPVAREDEENPAIFQSPRKASDAASGGHSVRVLRRSALREAVGDQSAADALALREAHRMATA